MSERDLVCQAGRWAIGLRPETGGAVTRLTLDGRDILRPTPDDATQLFDFASFPLVPYANRIAYGRLTVDGTTTPIPANYPGQAHPLHGVGWLAPWRVAEADERHAVMLHDHAGDPSWPFAYAARQEVTVGEAGVSFTLSLTNRGDTPMPFSLGFHPYFAGGDGLTLGFQAGEVWLANEQFLPTHPADPDHFGPIAALPVRRADLLDNSFAGWTGSALIQGPDLRLRLAGEGMSVLHVYMPPEAGFFCAEPATALPDGVNRAPERLAPGEERRVTMRIEALD